MMISKLINIVKRKSTATTRLALSSSLLVVVSLLSNTASHAQDIALDKIAAIVNDEVVMFSEVRGIALQAKKSANTQKSDQALIKEALESLILERVQLQRAKALGIIIDNVAVNQAMLSIAERNKLNLEQFRIALQSEGHNYKAFRENIREKLYIQSLRKRQQQSSKSISENDVDDLIKAQSQRINQGVQYHLIDIFVPAPNGISVPKFNNLLRHTQSLKKQLLKSSGQLSDKLINTMGASSKDIGWKSTQSLSPATVRSLSLIGTGELTEVVRDSKGFHIYKLLEQRGGERKISKQARVRHILISADDPQAKIKATILRNKIIAGEDFATLARKNSSDKGSAVEGGNLAMADISLYVPPFAKAVTSLPLNSLSQPVQTRFGWHIIEVLERKTSDKTREALKSQAQSVMTKEKKKEELANWLQSLRDEAFVEYRMKL